MVGILHTCTSTVCVCGGGEVAEFQTFNVLTLHSGSVMQHALGTCEHIRSQYICSANLGQCYGDCTAAAEAGTHECTHARTLCEPEHILCGQVA